MPLYRAPASDVQPAAAPAVTCRCCPGGISRSTRARRYPSDMTGAEWAVCEPLLPAPAWLAGRGGRPSRYCMRDIVDAIRYRPITGRCGGRCRRTSRPPGPSITGRKWEADGSAARMHDDLRDASGRGRAEDGPDRGDHRLAVGEGLGDGRPHPPWLRRREEDQRDQAAPRRRHRRPAADGAGHRRVRADRDAAKPLLWNLRRAFPSIQLAWADGGYAGKLVTWAKTALHLTLQIVKRPDDLHTFKVLPRRWVVTHTVVDHPPPRPSGTTSGWPPATRPTSTGQ